MSFAESLTALVSKYVDCVVASEQSEVEEFFSHLVARSKARDAIHALLAAREFSYVHVGGHVLLQVSSLQFAAERRNGREACVCEKGLVRSPAPAPDSRHASGSTSATPQVDECQTRARPSPKPDKE